MKTRHALAADACFIERLQRQLREQLFGNVHLRAPARAFVGSGSTELAIVRLAAQRAEFRRDHALSTRRVGCCTRVHGNRALTR